MAPLRNLGDRVGAEHGRLAPGYEREMILGLDPHHGIAGMAALDMFSWDSLDASQLIAATWLLAGSSWIATLFSTTPLPVCYPASSLSKLPASDMVETPVFGTRNFIVGFCLLACGFTYFLVTETTLKDGKT